MCSSWLTARLIFVVSFISVTFLPFCEFAKRAPARFAFVTSSPILCSCQYCRRHLHNFFQKVAVLTAMKNRGNAQGDSQHLTVTCSHFFTFFKLFRKPANISVAASSVILPATMSAFSFSHSSLASCSAAKISSLVWVK